MRRKHFFKTGLFSFSLFMAGTFFSCSKHVEPPQPYGALPTEHQMEWQKMEYYMFIHFGPNTFTDVEWGDGKEDPKVFNPTNLDCRQWAETAKKAGMKGIIITAKHHDGFCLWPSRYSTHTVRESLWKDGKGDLLKELSEACKEYELKFGVYLSPWDQNHPAYGKPEYNQIFANTLQEVLGNYGEIFEQWFDGANGEGHGGKKQVYDWNLFHDVVYRNQPQAIIFSDVGPGCRWMGNERGIAGETNWSRLNITGFAPGRDAPPTDSLNMGNVHGEAWVPAETDVSIRPGWFYSPSTDDKVKTTDHLLDIYYASVGRNSNLLLNVPPDRTGRIHRNDSIRLIEFRQAIDKVFDKDLTKGASADASNQRGGSNQYGASNILNDNYDSYWTTDDNVTTASVEINLNGTKTFNRILLQEYLPLGQRIAQFSVEAWINDSWEEIASATTIGYKRILRFPAVSAQKIRINIENSLDVPILNKVSLHMAEEKLSMPEITRNKEGMVRIKCITPDPIIYYTLDGTEPTLLSTLYKGEFLLHEAGEVKAISSISNGASRSEVVSISYDIAPVKWSVISPKLKDIERIIDGNEKYPVVIKNKEAVVIDLGETLTLKGFVYVPLANENANNVYRYNFYTSNDGKTWNKIKTNSAFDNIKNNPVKQSIKFDKQVSVKFIKLEPLQTTNAAEDYTITEIGIITG